MPTIDELKGLFAQGKRPDGIDFEQLIDATYGNGVNLNDTLTSTSTSQAATANAARQLKTLIDANKITLNNTLNSTSTTEAATANAVKMLNDLIGENKVTLNDTLTSDSATEASTANVARQLKTLIDSVNVDATKTQRGLVKVGNGLNVSGGFVSGNYYIDDTRTLDSLPNGFLVGQTLTNVIPSANVLQNALSTNLYNIMGYTLTSNTMFKFQMVTIKHTGNYTFQEIRVYNNNAAAKQIFNMTRQSVGTNWSEWSLDVLVNTNKGNPNGVVSGFRGFLLLDVTSGVLYVKKTGISAQDNMGWESVGGTSV